MVRVEFRQSLAVVDGIPYDNHGGESEVVFFHDLCQVLQFSPVYPFVFPREVIAGGNGGCRGIMLHQFGLDLIDDGGTEEDTHGAL